jgi:hypothetical protein
LDESGEFKILSGGELKSYDLTVGSRKSEVKTGILATSPKLTIIMDTGMEEPMLQPPPPVVRKATASFYFHPEDEEEAAKFKEIPDSSSGKRYSLDKILYKTRENYQLDIKS